MADINPIYSWWQKGLKNRLIINPKDGSILVEVPAGEFEMGDGTDSYNLKHRIFLDTYYIGVFAVTNRQYKLFMDQTGHRAPDYYPGGVLNKRAAWAGHNYPEQYANHPVVCVSWNDAQAYCKWAGLSLPTEAQWEKAARGPLELLYPWSNEWIENKCRNIKNRGSEKTCVVSEYAKGTSGYGTYNQAGNVMEWCYDFYDWKYYKNSPPSNPINQIGLTQSWKNHVYRGGGFTDGADCCQATYRNSYDHDHSTDKLGFRPALTQGQRT